MMRDQDNGKYRSVMKNVLEFDPQVLKRFVNFMNNPDEKSAIEQFGDGDKYFGVATMMCTMPGLPMFGHGQIEGYHEKYGMEYRRAYWDEYPNGGLIARHEWQIFPLLRRRYLFADMENFLLYDVFSTDGYVNEDVFAYSNGSAYCCGKSSRVRSRHEPSPKLWGSPLRAVRVGEDIFVDIAIRAENVVEQEIFHIGNR